MPHSPLLSFALTPIVCSPGDKPAILIFWIANLSVALSKLPSTAEMLIPFPSPGSVLIKYSIS